MCGGFVGKLFGGREPEKITPPPASATVENHDAEDGTDVNKEQRKKRGFSSTRTSDTVLSGAGKKTLG